MTRGKTLDSTSNGARRNPKQDVVLLYVSRGTACYYRLGAVLSWRLLCSTIVCATTTPVEQSSVSELMFRRVCKVLLYRSTEDQF